MAKTDYAPPKLITKYWLKVIVGSYPTNDKKLFHHPAQALNQVTWTVVTVD